LYGADVLGLALSQRDNNSSLEQIVLTIFATFFGSTHIENGCEYSVSTSTLLKPLNEFLKGLTSVFLFVSWHWWR